MFINHSHKSPSLLPSLSCVNPVHTLPTYFFKTILIPPPILPNGLFPSGLPIKTLKAHLFHSIYYTFPLPTHPTKSDHPKIHSSTSSEPMFSPQHARPSSKPTLNNRQNNSCVWIHMPGLCQQNQIMHVMLHSDHNNLNNHVQNNKQFKNHTLSAVLIQQRLV